MQDGEHYTLDSAEEHSAKCNLSHFQERTFTK